MEPISASTVLSTIGSVVTTGYQIYTYLSAVKNAPRSAKALETEVAALDIALKKIQQFLENREKEGKTSFETTSVLFRTVNGCKEEIESLFKKLDHFRSSHLISRIFHRFTWPLSEADTVKATEVLHRYAQIFQLSMTTDLYEFFSESCSEALNRLAKLQSSNVSITTDFTVIIDLLTAIGDGLSESKFKEFVEWIPTIPFQEKHHYIQTHRLEGSGNWLLDSPEFQVWKDFENLASNPTLFCQGDPGVGKSYICSILTDHLVDLARQTGARVAYFYFDYKSQETQRPFSVVSCLLRQVLSQYSVRPKPVDALWEIFYRKQGFPSWQLLVEKFCQLCSETRVYIVLDALDECDASENRGPILGFIAKMRQENVRLFATSRPFPQDVLNTFEGAVPVDIKAASTDLRSYLLDFIAKRGVAKAIMTKKRKEGIVAKIVENSQGMFLLATFQVEYVLSQDSEGEMDESIEVLPKGLWPNFDITMDRISKLPHEHQIRRAKLTLLWITTAARPLTVNELRHAIRISEAPLGFKPNTLPGEHSFVEYCFGFVIIDPRPHTVRLAHFSIDEYLRQRHFEFITSGPATVAIACLNYMLLPWTPGITSQGLVNEGHDDVATKQSEGRNIPLDEHIDEHILSWLRLRQTRDYSHSATTINAVFPFMMYAAKYWGDHAAKDFSSHVSDAVRRWLENNDSFLLWSCMDERKTGRDTGRVASNRLHNMHQALKKCHVAARYGLWELMSQDGIELGNEVNSTTANRDTPLMIAAERGHVEFLSALLAHPATKVNEVDVDGKTALCRAVEASQASTVRCLLAANDINVTLGTPLHLALDLGGAEMIGVLLGQKNLDINACRNGLTALASVLKDEVNLGLVRRILQRDDILPRFLKQPYAHGVGNAIGILTEDTDIMTDQELLQDFPLTVKALVEDFWARGLRDKRDRCLSWAWSWFQVRASFESSYLKWLEEGLDRQMADEYDDTILHDVASRTDGDDFLEQLLKHGFSADFRSADGRTPLQMAAQYGNLPGIELLLTSGADINAQDNDGWGALHYSANNGRVEVVGTLLDRGADRDSKSQRGRSAMQIAAQSGQVEVIRLLLTRGADSAGRTDRNETLLSDAICSGDEETVKLALAITGCDNINLFTTDGISPLMAACILKKPNLVKLLVEKGADVNAKGPQGCTALHAAIMEDNKENVKFLLDCGADPNAQDTYFGTPYTLAVDDMAETRTELLGRGGDISLEGAYGETAITHFSNIGRLKEELGEYISETPTSPAETRQRRIRRLKAVIQETLRVQFRDQGEASWHFSLIGDLLDLLANEKDAVIAFEQGVEWGNNHVRHLYTRCRACLSKSTTGTFFICTYCIRGRYCSACFSQHAGFPRVLFEQFSPEEVFDSGGRDTRWAGFLDINGLMDLRYDHVNHQDEHSIATPEGRQETILAMIRRAFEAEEAQDLGAKFPDCHKGHTFLCVPGPEWLTLAPGTVNTRGQAQEDWLRGLYDFYDNELHEGCKDI